jgi:hypothetical protein
MQRQKNWFGTMAQGTARAAGSSTAFIAICLITVGWLVSGPIFHWSDTWQLGYQYGDQHCEHADGLPHSEHTKSGELGGAVETG